MFTLILSYEYPPFKGGVGVVAENIFKRMSDESIVITSRSNNPSDEKVLRLFPDVKGFSRYLLGLITLLYCLFRFRTRKVIAVCPTSQRLCFFLSFVCKVQYVCVVHGSEVFWNTKSRIFGINLLSVYKRSLANFAVSEYVASLLKERSVKNISRFYLGLGDLQVRPVGEKIQNSIVSVSRLDRRKGHREIIEALALVKKRGLSFHYSIAGEGADAVYLKRLAEHYSLNEYVTFHGGISEAEKYELLGRSEIYVLHSLMHHDTVEGFGISYIEAGVYCNYVIGSSHGGVPEALSALPNSRIVEEGDIEALADALEVSLNERQSLTLTMHQRTQLFQTFIDRWDTSTKNIKAILKS